MSGLLRSRGPYRSAAADAGKATGAVDPSVLARKLAPPDRYGGGAPSATAAAVRAAVEAERRGYGANWRSPIRSFLVSIGRYR